MASAAQLLREQSYIMHACLVYLIFEVSFMSLVSNIILGSFKEIGKNSIKGFVNGSFDSKTHSCTNKLMNMKITCDNFEIVSI